MRFALLLALLVTLGCEPTASSPRGTASDAARPPAPSDSALIAPGPSAAASGADAHATSDGAALPETWLTRTLVAADPRWRGWLASAKELRLQILVTVVEPGVERWPTHELRADA